MRLFGSAVSAIKRPGRPYKAKVSKTGNNQRSIISNPVTAGCTSGITKTKPSVVDGGFEWIVMDPSTLTRVDASISGFDCGYIAKAEYASDIVAIGRTFFVFLES
jgi:hypothetical protein